MCCSEWIKVREDLCHIDQPRDPTQVVAEAIVLVMISERDYWMKGQKRLDMLKEAG